MDIGRELQALRTRLAKIERAARLGHAAIDNAAVQVKDSNGSLRGIIGVQADGTTAVNMVNGPPPPQPSDPIVASVLGGVTVSWDGQFTDGSPVPLDWSRVEVHASTDAVYDPVPATLQDTIETAQGATIVVSCDAPVYVRLMARNTSGAASTPSTAVGPLGPTAVVADDVLDGIITTVKLADDAVTTAKVAAGAINLNGLTAALADTASQRYVDSMADPTVWSVLASGTGADWEFLTAVTDAPTGTTVAQATGYTVVRGTTQIPYDPDVLYRVSARVRTTAASSAGSDTLYAGILGVAADGVTLVNRNGANAISAQHYVAASNASQPNGTGWTVYTGYLKGRAVTGGTGSGAPATDPRSAGVVHADVRFISPIFYLNFASGSTGPNSGSGTMQVDAFTIEALKTGVVDSTNLIAGSVTTAALAADSVTATQIAAGAIQAGAIAADAVSAGTIAADAVTAREIAALAVSTDELAANAVTAGKILAGSVDATALAADAITGKTITGGTINGTTITGGTLQTATSGERVTINESGNNKIFFYNSSNNVVASYTASGASVTGPDGNIITLSPAVQVTGSTSTYAAIRWVNAAQTKSAKIISPASATGELELQLQDSTGNNLFVRQASTELIGGRLRVFPPASTNNAIYLEADPAHTGNLIGLYRDGIYRAIVDKDGNTTLTGTLSVGGNLTVSGIGQSLTKRRTSDATKTNTITPATDSQITFTVDANAVYQIDGYLKYSGANDIVVGWTFPTGTQGEWQGLGNGTTVVSGTASNGTQQDTISTWGYTVRTESTDIANTRTHGGVTTTAFGIHIRGLIRVGSTAGTFALQWAQGTSGASATTLYTDSHIRLEKVA